MLGVLVWAPQPIPLTPNVLCAREAIRNGHLQRSWSALRQFVPSASSGGGVHGNGVLQPGLLPRAAMGLEVYHGIRENMNNIQPTLHMALSFRDAQPSLAPLGVLLGANSCVGIVSPSLWHPRIVSLLPLALLCVLLDANSCLGTLRLAPQCVLPSSNSWACPPPFGTPKCTTWRPFMCRDCVCYVYLLRGPTRGDQS